MRIQNQLYKICKILPYKELKMTKNIADKLKAMELIQIYLIFKNKTTITKISLHFFRFSSKFTPPDPDLHIECGYGSWREN